MLKGIGLGSRNLIPDFLGNSRPQSSPETSGDDQVTTAPADHQDRTDFGAKIGIYDGADSVLSNGGDRSSTSPYSSPTFSRSPPLPTADYHHGNRGRTCPDPAGNNEIIMAVAANHNIQQQQLERVALQKAREDKPLNLEFDGTTVLCRVCGDKASGFHYGVHSCEGCKGFFRRSIQQKIQYRPCLKNQQCSILRINRNRCQYCRLKKCIAVGMSRDAVRFGRVPKREKAKILAEMSRVINARSSHKTDSSSTSPEVGKGTSSPDRPIQDGTEQMDRYSYFESDQSQMPSFDVAAIVKAHDETFHHPLGMIDVAKLKEYRRWALTKQNFADLMTSETIHNTDCPLSEVLGNFLPPQQGTPKNGGYARNYTSAIHDVVEFAKRIPGFTSLHQEDQLTLLKTGVLEVLLVRMARFFDSETDTVMLTDGRLLKRPHEDDKADDSYGAHELTAEKHHHRAILFDAMFDFAHRFNSLGLSESDIALFSAAVLVASDRPGVKNFESVASLQDNIIRAMRQKLARSDASNMSSLNGSLFTRVIMKVPELRNLNALHSEKVIMLKILSSSSQSTETREPTRWNEWPLAGYRNPSASNVDQNVQHDPSGSFTEGHLLYKRQYSDPILKGDKESHPPPPLGDRNVNGADMSVLRSCLEKAPPFYEDNLREFSMGNGSNYGYSQGGFMIQGEESIYQSPFLRVDDAAMNQQYKEAIIKGGDGTTCEVVEKMDGGKDDFEPFLGQGLKACEKDEILRAFLSRPKSEQSNRATVKTPRETNNESPYSNNSRPLSFRGSMCSSRSARKKEQKALSHSEHWNKDRDIVRRQSCVVIKNTGRSKLRATDSPKKIASSFSLPDSVVEPQRRLSPRSCSSVSPPKRFKQYYENVDPYDHDEEFSLDQGADNYRQSQAAQSLAPKTMTPLQRILSRNGPTATVMAQRNTISPRCASYHASSLQGMALATNPLGPWMNPFLQPGHHVNPYHHQHHNLGPEEAAKMVDPFALLKMLPTPPPDNVTTNNANVMMSNFYGVLPGSTSSLANAAYYKAAAALALHQHKQAAISSLSPPQDELPMYGKRIEPTAMLERKELNDLPSERLYINDDYSQAVVEPQSQPLDLSIRK